MMKPGDQVVDVIRVEGLVKKFGWFLSRKKVTAVNNLSLSVGDNRIMGFLGPNGAGKTTTIKILLGLIIPDAGNAYIFEKKTGDRNIRGRVGFLPDNPCFYNHLTGMEFVAFCGKLMHIARAERYRRSEELLEKMGLGDAAHQKVEGYSRGMLQRLGIAQALINDPDLIILDEPVTGLDPLGRREVKQILLDLRSEGKTVFFSSHVLADVEQMCDEVAILNHGQLLAKGELDSILEVNGYTLWATGLPDSSLGDAEGMSIRMFKEGERWGFSVKDGEAKEKLSSYIETNGGKVVEVNVQKETLEASFLRRIEEDNAKRKEGNGHG